MAKVVQARLTVAGAKLMSGFYFDDQLARDEGRPSTRCGWHSVNRDLAARSMRGYLSIAGPDSQNIIIRGGRQTSIAAHIEELATRHRFGLARAAPPRVPMTDGTAGRDGALPRRWVKAVGRGTGFAPWLPGRDCSDASIAPRCRRPAKRMPEYFCGLDEDLRLSRRQMLKRAILDGSRPARLTPQPVRFDGETQQGSAQNPMTQVSASTVSTVRPRRLGKAQHI